MDREIKFRGKRIDNGELVYGYYYQSTMNDNHYIADLIETKAYQVDEKTVGQYTGLKDKNKKEIYENSVVLVCTVGINYDKEYYVKGIIKCIDGCFTVLFSEPIFDVTLKAWRKSLYVKCFTVNHAIEVIEE